MDAGLFMREKLKTWSGLFGDSFPRLREKVRRVLNDPNATELDYADILPEVLQAWAMMGDAPEQIEEAVKVKRSGRPRKEMKAGGEKVLAALKVHHQFASGGVIDNPVAASLGDLAELSGVSKATVSRHLEAWFQHPGYQRYAAACEKGTLGFKLALMSGETPSLFTSLEPDAYRSDVG